MVTRAQTLGRHLQRAALVATLLPLLVMVALGLWQYTRDSDRVQAFTGTQCISSARIVAGFVDFLVGESRAALDRIGTDASHGRIKVADLKAVADSQPQTDAIEVTDANGTVVGSALGHEGQSVARKPYFAVLRRGLPIAFSQAYYSPWLKENVVIIAVPYRRAGSFAGIVMARLNLGQIDQLISAHLGAPWLRGTFVMDRDGTPIIGASSVDAAARKAFAKGGDILSSTASEGWLPLTGAGAPDVVAGYSRMASPSWMVVSLRQGSTTLLLVQEGLRNQLVLAVLAAVLASSIAFTWGRRLARPIETMEAAMRQVQQGGFEDARVALAPLEMAPTVQEFGTLALGFRAMVTELDNRFNAILDLQKELVERNRELAVRNDELVGLTQQAQSASRLKSEFLATMSHELRTPLNSIIGFTQLALTDPELTLDAETRTNLTLVLKSARHLLQLINGVLDLSRIEAGKAEVHAELIDAKTVVEAVVTTVLPAAREKGLALSFRVAEPVGRVECDETKLRQIVTNLVANAVKFTAEGHVEVVLGPSGQDGWQVAVTDTGPGIAADSQEVIFEEFRQLDASATRTAGGTGLGLAIARNLARLLGGDLAVTSELGEGSTFVLVLPCRLGGVSPHPAPGPRQAPLAKVTSAPLGGQVVVIVDEDPQSSMVLAEQLRACGCIAVPASRPADALAVVRALGRSPAAIAVDLKSRAADALAPLRSLAAEPALAGIPIFAMGFDDHRSAASAMGAVAYLLKPVDPDTLQAALTSLFERSARKEELPT